MFDNPYENNNQNATENAGNNPPQNQNYYSEDISDNVQNYNSQANEELSQNTQNYNSQANEELNQNTQNYNSQANEELNQNTQNYTEQPNDANQQNYSENQNVNTENANGTFSSYEWNASDFPSQQNNNQNTQQTQQNNNPNTQLNNEGFYSYSGSQIKNSTDYYSNQNLYGQQTQYPQSTQAYPYTVNTQSQGKPKKKKERKPIGRGSLAAIFVVGIILSCAAGFGGGILSKKIGDANGNNTSNGVTINKVLTSVDKTKSDATELSTSEIADITANSVVEITTEAVTTGGFSQQYISSGAGSGVIISENGYIITNNHVIEGASKITITLKNGDSYTATLVGTDSTLDVALLKIDAKDLKPATFGDSSILKVGDKTVAIGNPLGQLGGTVTDGIISALNRDVLIDNVTMNLMQTNAAINPGNSGGGLFNGKGELIGLVVAKSAGSQIEGLGFAVPINDVSDIIGDLTEYGYVRGRISLGLSLVDISSNQMAMMYNVTSTGCYISSVERGTNAAKAGLKSGDRIVSVNGTKVETSQEIKAIRDKCKVGDTIVLKIDRNNVTQDISFVLEEDIPNTITNKSNNNNDSNNDSNNEKTTETTDEESQKSIFDYFGW